MIYIGDNPNKDFINLNKKGAYTIQILTKQFHKIKLGKIYYGKYKINSLAEILPLIQNLKKKNEKI